MASFRAAVADGAQGIELDVRLSRDRQPVVIHDATLDRTTQARGVVRGLTRDELERVTAIGLRWKSLLPPSAAAEDWSVPSLERVLEFAARARVRVFVELKHDAAFESGLDESVVELIHRLKAHDIVRVISFNAAAIARVKRADERIVTALNIRPTLRSPLPSPRQLVDRVRRAEADGASVHVSLATPRRVVALRDAELGVHVWTVNRAPAVGRCVALGVDSIMTDHPALFRASICGEQP